MTLGLNNTYRLLLGDCLEQMKSLPDNSVDSIVTDPPYGLSFMNKHWDYDVPSVEVWREALRVLKPGGHALIACGTRTQHRMTVNVEDAGFEIRDVITWLYGSGFPKSHNLPGGIGTALKPACEFWTLARKPLIGTVAKNVEAFGVGGLNIDESRIGTTKSVPASVSRTNQWFGEESETGKESGHNPNIGRWPANVLFDEAAAAMLDEQTGELHPSGNKNGGLAKNSDSMFGIGLGSHGQSTDYKDSGGASRFFYCAKASKSERNAGLEGMPDTSSKTMMRSVSGSGKKNFQGGFQDHITKNHHPTVKPIRLMQYLIKLITPPGGTCLDPFMGSGSTGVAAKSLGFDFIGIEMNEEYLEIAKRRIEFK
jgi:site-specific DNA-methyltransferase (adenine-specific)